MVQILPIKKPVRGRRSAHPPLFLIGIGSYHLYANKWKRFPYRLHILAASLAAALIAGWHWLALLI